MNTCAAYCVPRAREEREWYVRRRAKSRKQAAGLEIKREFPLRAARWFWTREEPEAGEALERENGRPKRMESGKRSQGFRRELSDYNEPLWLGRNSGKARTALWPLCVRVSVLLSLRSCHY